MISILNAIFKIVHVGSTLPRRRQLSPTILQTNTCQNHVERPCVITNHVDETWLGSGQRVHEPNNASNFQNRQHRSQIITNGTPSSTVYYRRPVLFDDQTITPLPFAFETETRRLEGEPLKISACEDPRSSNCSHHQRNYRTTCPESTSTSTDSVKRTKVVTTATAARVIAAISKYNVDGVDLIPAGDRLFGKSYAVEANNKLDTADSEYWSGCPPDLPEEAIIDTSHYLQVRDAEKWICLVDDPRGSLVIPSSRGSSRIPYWHQAFSKILEDPFATICQKWRDYNGMFLILLIFLFLLFLTTWIVLFPSTVKPRFTYTSVYVLLLYVRFVFLDVLLWIRTWRWYTCFVLYILEFDKHISSIYVSEVRIYVYQSKVRI